MEAILSRPLEFCTVRPQFRGVFSTVDRCLFVFSGTFLDTIPDLADADPAELPGESVDILCPFCSTGYLQVTNAIRLEDLGVQPGPAIFVGVSYDFRCPTCQKRATGVISCVWD